MPPERPGSLPAQTYIDIIAFILQKNAFPAGDVELSADPAALHILITATRPAANERRVERCLRNNVVVRRDVRNYDCSPMGSVRPSFLTGSDILCICFAHTPPRALALQGQGLESVCGTSCRGGKSPDDQERDSSMTKFSLADLFTDGIRAGDWCRHRLVRQPLVGWLIYWARTSNPFTLKVGDNVSNAHRDA